MKCFKLSQTIIIYFTPKFLALSINAICQSSTAFGEEHLMGSSKSALAHLKVTFTTKLLAMYMQCHFNIHLIWIHLSAFSGALSRNFGIND